MLLLKLFVIVVFLLLSVMTLLFSFFNSNRFVMNILLFLCDFGTFVFVIISWNDWWNLIIISGISIVSLVMAILLVKLLKIKSCNNDNIKDNIIRTIRLHFVFLYSFLLGYLLG